jgi:hypothetical protein
MIRHRRYGANSERLPSIFILEYGHLSSARAHNKRHHTTRFRQQPFVLEAWSSVSFRQGCVTRLADARIGLRGRLGTGAALREGGLVVPGHPVGGVRGDGGGVAL